MRFSLDRAIGQAGDIAPRIFTAPKLENLFMRAGLSHFQPPPRSGTQRYGKDDLVTSTLYAAQSAASNGDYYAEDGLKEFIRLVAEKSSDYDFERLLEPRDLLVMICSQWEAKSAFSLSMSHARRSARLLQLWRRTSIAWVWASPGITTVKQSTA
jgi:hypothetical protein